MPSIDQSDGASVGTLTALPSTLEIFDKFKPVSENGKHSDSEESFHLLLDDDDNENQSNGGDKDAHNEETEDEILNKFETAQSSAAADVIDQHAEETILNDEEDQSSNTKIDLKTVVKIDSKEDSEYANSPKGEFKSLYEDEVEPDVASEPMEVHQDNLITNGETDTFEDSMGADEEDNNVAGLIDKLEEEEKEEKEEEGPFENGTPMESDSCDVKVSESNQSDEDVKRTESSEDGMEVCSDLPELLPVADSNDKSDNDGSGLDQIKEETPQEEMKNDDTVSESDGKKDDDEAVAEAIAESASITEKAEERSNSSRPEPPEEPDSVFKVPEEVPKEERETKEELEATSSDKSNDKTEDESDLLDVTMVREMEEDDACAMADAMTDIETRTSEKSDEERMDTEQETSDNDKEEEEELEEEDFDDNNDNAMGGFDETDEDSRTPGGAEDDSSSSVSQPPKRPSKLTEISDSSNNGTATVSSAGEEPPSADKSDGNAEIGGETVTDDAVSTKIVEERSALDEVEKKGEAGEEEVAEKEVSDKSGKIVLGEHEKTDKLSDGPEEESEPAVEEVAGGTASEQLETKDETVTDIPENYRISTVNKRGHVSSESEADVGLSPKKAKIAPEPAADEPSAVAAPADQPVVPEKLTVLTDFAKFMQCRKLAAQLTRSDLEQFCIQKICECLMLKSTEGELHQQIKKNERTIEVLRKDISQLAKQCKDLDIVNKKLVCEMKGSNASKRPLVPLKITRSVGLQVRLNPGADQSRNKRSSISGLTSTSTTPQKQTVPSPSPNRKPGQAGAVQTSSAVRQALQGSPQRSSPLTSAPTTTSNTLLSQALQTRGKPSSPGILAKRPASTTAAPARKPSGVIVDLTDEDDRAKSGNNTIKLVSRQVGTQPGNATNNKSSPVNKSSIPSVKANIIQGKQVAVAKTTAGGKQSTLPQGIRLAQAIQTTSANGSPQMVYVVPTITNAGGQQKVAFVNFQPTMPGQTVSVLSNTSNNSRTGTTGAGLTLKTIASGGGGGGIVTTGRPQKHPAPLPSVRVALDPKLKPLLPKPHLTIKRIDTGIILQWKMPYNLDQYESIASYQLYAYQETSAPPSTDMWRKVGDVKALALPMACTLTQFADKNKYYFAVRSVDVHKRIGAFSDPEEISL